MAKQLSMEELIKKYQYLRTNQQSLPRTEANQKTHEKDNPEFSKLSSRSIASNAPFESSSSSSAPTSSEDTCKVCLDAEANCAFIECGHIVSCLNCAKLLTKCPICRETIKRTLRVYKS